MRMNVVEPSALTENVLLLQMEAFQQLLTELYVVVEAQVELTHVHPLTHERVDAVAHSRAQLTWRDSNNVLDANSSNSESGINALCHVSKLLAELVRDHCAEDVCIREPRQMALFLKRVHQEVRAMEDRIQVVMILDVTLDHKATNPKVFQFFESSKGYELMLSWMAEAATEDTMQHRQFMEILLKFLIKHVPERHRWCTTVLQQVRNSTKTQGTLQVFKGRTNKELAKRLCEQYQLACHNKNPNQ